MDYSACAQPGLLETVQGQSDEAVQFRASSAVLNPTGRIHRLTVVLERLWVLYEAMRSGRPVPHSTELLAEMSSALHQATKAGIVPAATAVASPATGAFS